MCGDSDLFFTPTLAVFVQTMAVVLLQLNLGKFAANGRSGYIRKPLLYTDANKSFNPFTVLPIGEIIAMNLDVEVLSGQVLNSLLTLPPWLFFQVVFIFLFNIVFGLEKQPTCGRSVVGRAGSRRFAQRF
jgi:hypothetical protein